MPDNTASALRLPVEGAGDPWWTLWRSYIRHLNAESRSPRTLDTYDRAARHFHDYLVSHQAPTDPARLTRQHLEEFLVYLRDERGQKAATIHIAYASLRGFFSWLVDEGEIEVSPMARIKAPKVDEPPPDVIGEEQIRALLRVCEARGRNPYETFLNRRDGALIRFMVDTGLRRSEVLGVRLEDLNLEEMYVRTVRKGSRQGIAFFGAKTGRDLDRYLRVRARQTQAASPYLWLPGSRGGVQLGDDGLSTMLHRRAEQAGIAFNVHPHAFRHAFADALKAGGASDEDVMAAGGWRDAKVMRRYAAARSLDRARDTHRRLSPGDRL